MRKEIIFRILPVLFLQNYQFSGRRGCCLDGRRGKEGESGHSILLNETEKEMDKNLLLGLLDSFPSNIKRKWRVSWVNITKWHYLKDIMVKYIPKNSTLLSFHSFSFLQNNKINSKMLSLHFLILQYDRFVLLLRAAFSPNWYYKSHVLSVKHYKSFPRRW